MFVCVCLTNFDSCTTFYSFHVSTQMVVGHPFRILLFGDSTKQVGKFPTVVVVAVVVVAVADVVLVK